MTLLLERPVERSSQEPPPRPKAQSPIGAFLRRHGISMIWLTPLVFTAGALHMWGMFRAPQRVDDEGTYMAQAYAVQNFGTLAHYTYWYDHPPLGWLQLALWTTVTDGFDRAASAVAAGREAMLVAHLVATILLWVLARHLGLGRPASAVAVLAYALTPLGLYFHRMVYLDNIAVVWLLAAFALATVRHRQLLGFTGAAMSFAICVLTKETFVLLLPVLAWVMWRYADRDTRRYTLTVASSLFVLLCSGYLVFAALKSELVPGPRRVSLWEGVMYQLVERPGSGSIWNPDSAARDTFEVWMRLDPVLLTAGAVSAIALLFVAHLRPFAIAYLALGLVLVRPGYLPIPYVVVLLPFAALLVAAALQASLRHRRLAPAAGAVAAIAVVGAALAWPTQTRQLTTTNADLPMVQAEKWITANVAKDEKTLVDDAVWADLVQAGYPRRNVVWYFKADTDPALRPGGKDPKYDYLMVTTSVRGTLAIGARTGRTPYRQVMEAYKHSVPVARYGHGSDQVEIRRVSDEL
jgi:hypothetical protein